MTRFLLAFLTPHLVLAGVALYPSDGSDPLSGALALLSILAGIPLAAAWLTFELLHRLRPRRHFHPLSNATGARLVAGAAAGLLSVTLASLTIALFPNPPSDPYTFAAAAAVATALTLLCLPRFMPASCPSCGYDLTHSPTRCPECGSTALPPHRETPPPSDASLVTP